MPPRAPRPPPPGVTLAPVSPLAPGPPARTTPVAAAAPQTGLPTPTAHQTHERLQPTPTRAPELRSSVLPHDATDRPWQAPTGCHRRLATTARATTDPRAATPDTTPCRGCS